MVEAVMLRHAAAYGVFDDEETLLQAVSAMMFMYRNDSLEARIDASGNLMQQQRSNTIWSTNIANWEFTMFILFRSTINDY